jgi:hypothetical protein
LRWRPSLKELLRYRIIALLDEGRSRNQHPQQISRVPIHGCALDDAKDKNPALSGAWSFESGLNSSSASAQCGRSMTHKGRLGA